MTQEYIFEQSSGNVFAEFQRFSEGKLLIFLKRLDTEITLHLRPRNGGNQSAETVILL